MAELLPDNLELAHRSQSEIQRNLSCTAKAPKKRELMEDWKGLGGNNCAPDHLKADCALASLESAPEQPCNRVMDTRQSGLSRKRFRREHLPHKALVPAQGEWPTAFPLTKVSISATLNHVSETTGAFDVGKNIN